MTLLVTGANGLIGKRTVELAVASGLEVLATDYNIAPAHAPGFRSIGLDLTDQASVSGLLAQRDITCCIHLAAISTERAAKADPQRAYMANVTATQALLDMARDQNWRMITASTASVFQSVDPGITGLSEDMAPRPSQTYAKTKLAAEVVTSRYRNEFGVSAAAVRLTGVYGPPRMPQDAKANPIPRLLYDALMQQSVHYASGGDWQNAYTYVDDAAAGLLALCSAKKIAHEIYHLTPGRNFTTHDVARAVEAAVPGARIELGPGTDPWGQSLVARPPLISTYLEADCGFAPQISLKEGIRHFADWMRKELVQ